MRGYPGGKPHQRELGRHNGVVLRRLGMDTYAAASGQCTVLPTDGGAWRRQRSPLHGRQRLDRSFLREPRMHVCHGRPGKCHDSRLAGLYHHLLVKTMRKPIPDEQAAMLQLCDRGDGHYRSRLTDWKLLFVEAVVTHLL